MDVQNTMLKEKDELVLVPAADIYETEESYVLRCEMPGVARENLEVTLNNNELEINGSLSGEGDSDEGLAYSEYRLHSYHRKFVVDDSINTSGISANLDNGLLVLTLPKSEKVKPRKIEVAVG